MQHLRLAILGAAMMLAAALGHAADLKSVQVYKSPSCGCCEKYIEYLKQNGVEVLVIPVPDMAAIKAKYNVPPALQSCHTSLVNNYVVEGHVPIGSLKKLLAEGRNIKGIALPGMPPGSPGMGPMKAGTLTVYEIPKAGEKPRVFSIE
jgi:hypothetical protein